MLEHVMEYQSIVREWARILTPGGKILIMRSAYLYGHHLHTIVPLPWIHMVLDPAALPRRSCGSRGVLRQSELPAAMVPS